MKRLMVLFSFFIFFSATNGYFNILGAENQTFLFPLETYDPARGFGTLVTSGYYKGKYHTAQDSQGEGGTPVYAAADGIISYSGTMNGYGWLIIVDHPTAEVYSLYGHLSTRRWKKNSGTVKIGELIGYLADDDEDGGSWLPHLHFSIRKGQRADYPGSGDDRWMAGYTHDYPTKLGWLDPVDFIDLQGSYELGIADVFSNVTTLDNGRAMPYIMPEDGYIKSISTYHNGGSGKMLLGLYADNGQGYPGSRLGVTAETDVSSIEGWQSVDLIAPVFVPAGTSIWLSWVYENNPGIRYQPGLPGRAMSNAVWNDGMPAAYGPSSIADYNYSIYATYKPGLATSEDVGNTEVFSNLTTRGERRAVPYSMPEDGFIQNISMYHNGGSGKMLLGLYTDDGLGNPGTQLALTEETDVSAVDGWQTVDLIIPVFVPAGSRIWLAWVYEHNPGIRYNIIDSPTRAESYDAWSNGMPAVFGPSTMGNYIYSIYATYVSIF